jgi:hypothetical protein
MNRNENGLLHTSFVHKINRVGKMMRPRIRALILALTVMGSVPLSGFQEIRYGIGVWDQERYGNHRVVIQVREKADAVRVHIPWRRRDQHPEKKEALLVDAKTGKRVMNLLREEITREYGNFVFQPVSGPGTYYLYHFPNLMTGRSNYPTVIYPEPEPTADPGWLVRNGFSPDNPSEIKPAGLPKAQSVEIQSIDPFDSFYPMEVIATAQEVKDLLIEYPGASYLLFPEDRFFPVRMADDLPSRWIRSGPFNVVEGTASLGEFYAYQIGVFGCRKGIEDVKIFFSDLENTRTDDLIPGSASKCISTGGIDWSGKCFKKVFAVEEGKVGVLWCGIEVPIDVPPGEYRGSVTIEPRDRESVRVMVHLRVKGEILGDAGDNDPWRQSRLRWLDSTIALDDGIVPPFIQMEVEEGRVACLGREMVLAESGLPRSIQSFFTPEVTRIGTKGREILASPIKLIVEDSAKSVFPWVHKGIRITKKSEGTVCWESKNTTGPLDMSCAARMEFDGYAEFDIRLTARREMRVDDIRLEIPLSRDIAKYMMGMGFKGGRRPGHFQWKWDIRNNQDSVWVGDVNAGLQTAFRDERYSRPLNTNFYQLKPLIMPSSWWNRGKGGCDFSQMESGDFLIRAYSGTRTIEKGEELHYIFSLLITPFKTLDTQAQWRTRYYHQYKPIKEIAATGANTINIHHANAINPYINYPFLRPLEMKRYIDQAHARGLKVKIYYTVRELTNRAAELFALRSLGDEIFAPGPGGGFSWLQEHLNGNYINGWFVPELKDAAIINSGVSRWHNYYLEGLNWLVENVGIDGLYIDDVAFDRTVMKRLRKILDRGKQGALIDLHSANQFNPRDGFASSANLYLEHFPYIDRLWFGEYFDYDSSPDFWLVEVSGIPFGLMGEMLQGGGNPWRGMLYGMTARLPWSGNPAPMWKFWDEFGMEDTEMIGYWSPDCPVKTDREDILATAYVKKDKALISLASWAEEDVTCRLRIDWVALGLNKEKARLVAPEIQDFQPSDSFLIGDSIPVEKGKGWLLILTGINE